MSTPATTVVISANSVAFTPGAPLSPVGDYAVFCYARPGKSEATILYIPAEVVACVDQWLATQVVGNPDGTTSPKYKHIGDLVRQRELSTTFLQILQQYPPASLLAARQAASAASAAVASASLDVQNSLATV